MSGIADWANNPDFQLFKPEDPDNPQWCADAQKLVEWTDAYLLQPLAKELTAGRVAFAKGKLFDRYMRLYHRTTDDHRPEKTHPYHHCTHEALVFIWQKLEDVETQAAIPELESLRLQLVPTTAGEPLPEPPSEPDVEEESGIVIGVEEEEQDEGDLP